MKRPRLTVISGDARPSSRWLDFPQSVVARSPFDKLDACLLRVSRADVVKAATQGRRQPAFDFWSVIAGQPPPVNNVRPVLPLMRLDEAHACFRGIKRPLAEDNDGHEVVAYVSKPLKFYYYDVRMAMSSLASPGEVPNDLVFISYARLDAQREPEGSGYVGVLTHWAFVECAPDDNMLPVDHETRYMRRLW